MYRCELCNTVVPPRTPRRLLVELRPARYPPRPGAHRHRADRHRFVEADPGGAGQEIARERPVCPDCAERCAEAR